MKIGILTHPIIKNYGGVLQAFASQCFLKKNGHEAWIIDREFNYIDSLSGCKLLIFRIKQIIKSVIGLKSFPENKKNQNIALFKEKYINPITCKFRYNKDMKSLQSTYKFEALYVGSDQVWRKGYTPCIKNYFLDFVEGIPEIKRIAYAASFGSDNWDFDKSTTLRCKNLLSKFDLVSVREQRGVELCKNVFDVDSYLVCDPTLLLEKEDYEKLFLSEPDVSSDFLFCYLLDPSDIKKKFIHNYANKTNLLVSSIIPKESEELPSISRWLSSIAKSKFVITDSYHGMIFSIIFNKPFFVLNNKHRGNSRFHTILEKLQIQKRIIEDLDSFDDKQVPDLNWTMVNSRVESFRRASTEKLLKVLE